MTPIVAVRRVTPACHAVIVGAIGCTCGAVGQCEACIESVLSYARGVAAVRGALWAEGVAFRHRAMLRRDWPSGTDKERAIAERKVSDLAAPSSRPDLHRRLVELVLTSARDRWVELQRQPERVRQLGPGTYRPKKG